MSKFSLSNLKAKQEEKKQAVKKQVAANPVTISDFLGEFFTGDFGQEKLTAADFPKDVSYAQFDKFPLVSGYSLGIEKITYFEPSDKQLDKGIIGKLYVYPSGSFVQRIKFTVRPHSENEEAIVVRADGGYWRQNEKGESSYISPIYISDEAVKHIHRFAHVAYFAFMAGLIELAKEGKESTPTPSSPAGNRRKRQPEPVEQDDILFDDEFYTEDESPDFVETPPKKQPAEDDSIAFDESELEELDQEEYSPATAIAKKVEVKSTTKFKSRAQRLAEQQVNEA